MHTDTRGQALSPPFIAIPRWDRLISPGLPRPATPLLGRDREVAECVSLANEGTTRLLTLTGPGGVGKTRLALRLAEVVASRYADGVAFTSLAAVRDPTLVPAAVAHGFGVRRGGDRLVAERLVILLRDRHLLLVLDNFEHLLPAAVFVADLLASCQALTILVTSRTVLRLSGEQAYPVPPLSLPAAGGPAAVTAVATGRSEAAQLFVARAAEAAAGFVLSDDNASDVAEICRRLDGLPLAIELAAAWVPILPPRSLLARLERRLPLLTGGPSDAPARLRTMRDAFAWSYDLLSPTEQSLFQRLAVFVSGFTIGAAEAVAGDLSRPLPAASGSVPPVARVAASTPSVLSGIAALVNHSLVHQIDAAAGSGEPRFAMLETIREFAGDRLVASGEVEAVSERHARFYLDHAEAAGPAFLHHFDQVLDRLEGEFANLMLALAWLRRSSEPERALRLGVALWSLWWYRSAYREGSAVLRPLLDIPRAGPSPARAKLLGGVGMLLTALGQYEQGVALQESSVRAWRDLGDWAEVAMSLWLLGYTLLGIDVARAEPVIRACLTLYQELGEAWGIGAGTYGLGRIARYQGDDERAIALLTESVVIGRRIDYRQGIGSSLETLGQIALGRGDLPRAGDLFAEALALFVGIRNEVGVAQSLEGLAGVAIAGGEVERGVRLVAGGAALRESIGTPVVPLDRPVLDQRVAAARALLGESSFAAAWLVGQARPTVEAIADGARLAAPAANPETAPPVAEGSSLSPRELEVLRLVATGQTDQRIAAVLFLSRRTVNAHVANILAKLGVATRAAATIRGHELGLLTADETPSRYT